jgi:hypothetical protein
MRDGLLGLIATPAGGSPPRPGIDWCADNACYAGKYPGDQRYLDWLTRHRPHADRCAFATAPDVVLNAAATLHRSVPMLERIRAAGYPAALVAQDGLERLAVPWDTFDVLFLGGSTDWKLSPAAAQVVREATGRGLPVHMGRVNSRRRMRYAASIGCRSADGTYLAYGPDRNLPTLLSWLRPDDTADPRTIQTHPTHATAKEQQPR